MQNDRTIPAVCRHCGIPFMAKRSSMALYCSSACVSYAQMRPVEERFWGHVEKTEGGCWLWTGIILESGYGQFWGNGKKHRAHRFSWELANGPIPDDLIVCHSCDVRACVNPEHLWLGTTLDNQRDCVAKGRKRTGDEHWARVHPEWVKRGASHSGTKVSPVMANEIRQRYATERIGMARLGAQYGVNASTVLDIVHGRHWTQVTAQLASSS